MLRKAGSYIDDGKGNLTPNLDCPAMAARQISAATQSAETTTAKSAKKAAAQEVGTDGIEQK